MFSLRIAWLAVSMATGMPMAVSATWTIIAPVQTRPKRSVAPPLPRFARCGCTRARVTFSAGRNANIAALTTARPPAIQNRRKLPDRESSRTVRLRWPGWRLRSPTPTPGRRQ